MNMAKSIAIIGASANRQKYGNKAVRSYQQAGWRVYPVNPHHDTIEGLPSFKSVLDIKGAVDRVSMYVPPKIGLNIINEVALKKPSELYLNPGSESNELIERAEKLGLNAVVACSIVNIGKDPSQYS